MSEYIIKTVKDYKHLDDGLPEIGKTVEVLCTMVTKASLVGTDPKQMWQQEGTMDEAQTEVKLWREIDDVKG